MLDHIVALTAIVVGAWTLIALALGLALGRFLHRAETPAGTDQEWLDVWPDDDPREHVLAMPYGEVLRVCDEISDYNRLDTWA